MAMYSELFLVILFKTVLSELLFFVLLKRQRNNELLFFFRNLIKISYLMIGLKKIFFFLLERDENRVVFLAVLLEVVL